LPERGLDRLRAYADDPRVRIAALLAAAAVAGFIWYQLGAGGRSGPVAEPVSVASAPAPSATAGTPAASTERGGLVTVHVAGAVTCPGVVRVPAGGRVVDAIDAAGGGLPDADLDRLNLAARLVDGQRVAVAKIGAPAPVEAGAPVGGSDGPGAESGPLNLNTATAEQLEELPGIGPATAAAIVEHRTRNGPFPSVDALTDVPGIGAAKLAQLQSLVRV
jgi:competence protein ComEA